MNKNKLDTLINKANRLRTPYKIDEFILRNVERKLGIILSEEFKYICKNYLYSGIGIEGFNISLEGRYSVIGVTLEYRKVLGLPVEFLSLSEDDASLIFMETTKDPKKPSPVYWISIEDVERFCKREPLEYDYTFFPTFTDFFERLIELEEESQQDD